MSEAIKVPLAVLGRILLALMFVLFGLDKLTNVAGNAGYVASVGLPAPAALAVLAGLLEVGCGLALIVGWQTKRAALALALFTLIASFTFHRFWAVPDAQVLVQKLFFLKNMSIAGGLFALAALGPGPASIDDARASRKA